MQLFHPLPFSKTEKKIFYQRCHNTLGNMPTCWVLFMVYLVNSLDLDECSQNELSEVPGLL